MSKHPGLYESLLTPYVGVDSIDGVTRNTQAQLSKQFSPLVPAPTSLDQHVVQFYQHSREIYDSLFSRVYSGLISGDMYIVIATPGICIPLQKALRARGIDIAAVLASGQYRPYDAEEMLGLCMNDHSFNRRRFRTMMMGLIGEVGIGEHIHIFGELVALLRQQHKLAALTDLEQAWDELAIEHGYDVYCACPDAADTLLAKHTQLSIGAMHNHTLYA